jgi:hypothetical protein
MLNIINPQELQIKTIVRYHLAPVRMIYYQKRLKLTNTGKNVEKEELSYTVGRYVNC